MGSGGGSSGAVDFPQYQKDIQKYLIQGAADTASGAVKYPEKGIIACLNDVIGNSPFSNWEDISVENLFFGYGYSDGNFPALFDMFGKFMAGLDIESLWTQIYDNTIDGPEISSAVAAHAADLDNDLEVNSYPRFHAGMRDINAVQSSAFVIGRSLIESQKTRDITKFAANIRLHALDIAQGRWDSHLKWNNSVITAYADLVKLFYVAKFDAEAMNYDIRGKDILCDIRAFEYPRAMLGALQGTSSPTGGQEVSQVAKSLSGVVGGAATGAQIGSVFPGYGTAIGAVVGGIAGLAGSFFS